MDLDTHRNRLAFLGLNDDSYRALLVLPAVRVGWIQGRLMPGAKDKILDIAKSGFGLGGDGMRAVERWIERPPTNAFFDAGLHELRRLTRAVDEPLFDFEMLHAAMGHAEAVARTNNSEPRAQGAPWALSVSESELLHQIATALGVDHGLSWAAVVHEVDSGARMPRSGPKGAPQTVVRGREVITRFESPKKRP